MCGRCGLGFVPVALALFSLATFVVTYIISFLRNDTSWFPAISDTADHSPESNVFGFLFNMCAALALLTTFIRFLQLRHDADSNERDRQLLIRLNKVAMFFGVLSSLGACIVANFQVLFEQLFLSKFKFILSLLGSMFYGSVNSQRALPPPGHLSSICHFVLEKLQMPHSGAGHSYKTPQWVLKIGCKCPTPGQHQGLFPFNPKFRKFRMVRQWNRPFQFGPTGIFRTSWSSLTGLVIAVGRTEMSPWGCY